MGTTMRLLQPAFHTCRPLMLQVQTLVVPCWRSACFAQPGRPPWILSSCLRCAFTGCRRADGSVSSLANQRRGGTGSAGSRGLLHAHTDSTPLQDANTEDHRRTDQSSDTHTASLPTHPPQPACQAVTGSSGCYTHNGTHCPFALHGPESWAYGVGRAVLHASWQQLAGTSGVIRLGDTASDRAAVLLTSPSAPVCFLAVQMELAPNTGPGLASGHSNGSVAWPMLNRVHVISSIVAGPGLAAFGIPVTAFAGYANVSACTNVATHTFDGGPVPLLGRTAADVLALHLSALHAQHVLQDGGSLAASRLASVGNITCRASLPAGTATAHGTSSFSAHPACVA